MTTVFETEESVAGRLFDLLAGHPDGLDAREIGVQLGLSRAQVGVAIRRLRLLLGDGSGGMNVPIRTQGRRSLYHLSGTAAEGATWQAVRAKTMVSRLRVDQAWWRSMVAGTNPETPEGRMARTAERHFARLLEDVESIQGVAL